jgi:hypothetical protein
VQALAVAVAPAVVVTAAAVVVVEVAGRVVVCASSATSQVGCTRHMQRAFTVLC